MLAKEAALVGVRVTIIEPGDPRKGAAAILKIAGMAEPPLRLPLGSDAIAAIEAFDRARLEELSRWSALSRSTDFG